MQTNLSVEFRDTLEGSVAESVLRKCVHCGFCNATCPTYELLGDELDGPRGRIYQMKQMFEGTAPNAEMRLHLDRCLTCRSCESTCPSGVEYSKLLEVGRKVLDEKLPRKTGDKWFRAGLRNVVSRGSLFAGLLAIGSRLSFLVPAVLRKKMPQRAEAGGLSWPVSRHQRKMLVLAGCVQPTLSPKTNLFAAKVLDSVGISLEVAPNAGCCGAVGLHTSGEEMGLQQARRLIDLWIPYLDRGYEAIIMTASGCGATVKEYGYLFRNDSEYASKAKRISDATRDLAEVIDCEWTVSDGFASHYDRVAFQAPCTLQHGQQIKGLIESILQRAGYSLTAVANPHLCCGSAGTYSILQADLSEQLRQNKLASLIQGQPEVICTANIGCQTHLASTSTVPVKHWIELLLE